MGTRKNGLLRVVPCSCINFNLESWRNIHTPSFTTLRCFFPGYYFSLPANAYLQDVSPFGATTTTTETKTTTAGTPTVSDNTLALVATNEYGEYDRRTLSFYGLEMLIEVRKYV